MGPDRAVAGSSSSAASSAASSSTAPRPAPAPAAASAPAASAPAPSAPAPSASTQAVRAFVRSFLLAYGARAGLAVLLKLVRIVREPKHAARHIAAAFGEDALRFGLFLGGFSGLYKLTLLTLNRLRGRAHTTNALVAGGVASLALFAEDPGRRLTVSHYLLARALQCVFSAAHSRGWFGFLDGFAHGDALLFVLSCGQIMYAYVLRPDTIPSTYYKFIVQTGPIPEVVLQNVRRNIRGQPVDLLALNKHIASRGGPRHYLRDPFPPFLDNTVLHPQNRDWVWNAVQVFLNSFEKIIPLYLPLTFAPMVLLRFRKVVSRPLQSALDGVLSAGRSTAFLAAFVALYQVFISAQRRLLELRFADFDRDHKLVYYAAGLFAGLSIFIERKSRRSELALYALPRAADSLYEIMYQHKVLHKYPHGEVALFAVAMSAIMYYFEHEPDAVSPLVHAVLSRFVEP